MMSLGPGDISVAKAVSGIIKWILQEMMLYPKKLVIPMLDNVNVNALANPAPTGILQIEMIGADNLRKADIMGLSDPYVVIKLGEKEVKTKVISNTLNPRWNEKFDILVHDKLAQVLLFRVFDEDVESDDPLGNCQIPLTVLTDLKLSAFNLPLTDTSTGSLLMKLTYVPLELTTMAFDPTESDFEECESDGSSESDSDVIENKKGAFVKKRKQSFAMRSLKAVKSKILIGREAEETEAAKVEPKIESKNDMGVLTVQDISAKTAKAVKMYCTVTMDGDVLEQTWVSAKDLESEWAIAYHVLVKGAKNAEIFVNLFEKHSVGSDKKVGSVRLRIAEMIESGYVVENAWPLTDQDSSQTVLKLKAIWNPAARIK